MGSYILNYLLIFIYILKENSYQANDLEMVLLNTKLKFIPNVLKALRLAENY